MRSLIMSVLLTIILSIAWSLIFKPKHRKTGFWMLAACYLSLTVIYLLEYTSLYWLGLITALSLILGLLMAFRGLRQIVFHAQQKAEVQVTVNKGKVVKQVQQTDKPTEAEYFAELERRGVPLQAPSGTLRDKPIGEILKEMEKAGIPITPRQ